ncbi:MAG: 4Fe-4S dicluster domain-containing protein [Bryobacteraceae bacterium]|nr:4Fe-4S dicluster domain-containing protein [Bryobacteraceae bacterium]
MQAAILTDTTKCIGCRQCVIACKRANNLEPDVPRRWALEDGLSARNWTSIEDRPDGKFVRKQCRHCLEPTCVSVCPVGALQKTSIGPVIYDGNKCMGCRYCMMACPYGIPRYDWDQTAPYVRKCILCYDRVKAGGQPACTEVCPTGATIFGDRSELLAIAHERVEKAPDTYIKKVWGEHEVGGTSVMYVSDTDLTFLTQGRELGNEPMPNRTKLAMNAVPFAFVGMATTMAGINWIIGRRMKLEREPEQASGRREDKNA